MTAYTHRKDWLRLVIMLAIALGSSAATLSGAISAMNGAAIASVRPLA